MPLQHEQPEAQAGKSGIRQQHPLGTLDIHFQVINLPRLRPRQPIHDRNAMGRSRRFGDNFRARLRIGQPGGACGVPRRHPQNLHLRLEVVYCQVPANHFEVDRMRLKCMNSGDGKLLAEAHDRIPTFAPRSQMQAIFPGRHGRRSLRRRTAFQLTSRPGRIHHRNVQRSPAPSTGIPGSGHRPRGIGLRLTNILPADVPNAGPNAEPPNRIWNSR